jgi:hypothetical protein
MKSNTKNFRNFKVAFFYFTCLSLFFTPTKSCENSCNACQQTVYQLKFQGKANCADACRDTCNKITETWNTPLNVYEFFQKDIFGKCEICFRAGFCSLSECDVQKQNELQIIQEIVNQSQLTAKTSFEDPMNFAIAERNLNENQNDVTKLHKDNHNLFKKIKTSLNESLTQKSSQKFLNSMKDLYHAYFDSVFDIPQQMHLAFNSTEDATKELTQENVLINSYSALSNYEDRISELEALSDQLLMNDYPAETKDEISKTVDKMKNEFGQYEKKIEKNLSHLDKSKRKLNKMKQEEDDDEEIKNIEEKITSMEKSLHELESNIENKKNRVDAILKKFK